VDKGGFMFQDITAQIDYSDSFPYLATVLGVTSIAGILAWRWWKQKNTYKSLQTLPSPPKHWLFGNLPQLLVAVKQKKLWFFSTCYAKLLKYRYQTMSKNVSIIC
jgi:hypothetical protein